MPAPTREPETGPFPPPADPTANTNSSKAHELSRPTFAPNPELDPLTNWRLWFPKIPASELEFQFSTWNPSLYLHPEWAEPTTRRTLPRESLPDRVRMLNDRRLNLEWGPPPQPVCPLPTPFQSWLLGERAAHFPKWLLRSGLLLLGAQRYGLLKAYRLALLEHFESDEWTRWVALSHRLPALKPWRPKPKPEHVADQAVRLALAGLDALHPNDAVWRRIRLRHPKPETTWLPPQWPRWWTAGAFLRFEDSEAPA